MMTLKSRAVCTDQAVECSVCQDKFVMDEEVCQLTKCEHLFHTDCITPWLKLVRLQTLSLIHSFGNSTSLTA